MYGTGQAYLIIFLLNLKKQNLFWKIISKSFESFYQQNKPAFTPEIRDILLQTGNAIAEV